MPALFISIESAGVGWFANLDSYAGGAAGSMMYQRWDSYNGNDPPSPITYQLVLKNLWVFFITGPITTWFFGATIRLVYYIEKRWRVKWWVIYPLFFLLDTFIPIRSWISVTLSLTLPTTMLSSWVWTFYPSIFSMWPEWLAYAQPNGVGGLKHWSPSPINIHVSNIMGRIGVYIWMLFIPCFTYYVYEPIFLQRYRQRIQYKVLQRE